MIKQYLIAFFILFQTLSVPAQQLKILSMGNPASLRGLCAVNDQVIWVSGSGGTVGISINSGISWKWITVPHYERMDFRDVEAFNDQEAVIMGITAPAVILKTKDAGRTWIPVFRDTSRLLFLDAMDFSGEEGILLGDPVDNKIFLAQTKDKGDSWKISTDKNQPVSGTGEAFFAASGSNIKWLPEHHFAYVSGGKKSALYLDSSGRFPLLVTQGKETTGANSIAVNPANPNQAFITGGDFSKDSLLYGNAVGIGFHPFHQLIPRTPPHGYRSCVEYIGNNNLICCGTTGVDISEDGGMNWKLISAKGFHVCRKAKSGNRIYLAGPHGLIASLDWEEKALKQ